MWLFNTSVVSKVADKPYRGFPFHNAACVDGKLLGALWALSQIRDALPLIHGPVGCSWQRKLSLSGCRIFYYVPCTAWTNVEVIYGGETKLREAIVEAYRRYRPGLIAVLTTCASDLTGDDVAAVVETARKLVSCPVIYSTGSRAGKFKQVGSQDLYLSIVEQYVIPVAQERKYVPEENTVNIVTLGGRYCKSFFTELEPVLRRCGIKVRKAFFEGRLASELPELAHVSMNIVPYPKLWAQELEHKLGVRQFVVFDHYSTNLTRQFPLGFENAKKLILEICDRLGVSGADKIIEEFYSCMLEKLFRIKKMLQGVSVAIERDWGAGLVLAIELGLNVKMLVFDTKLMRLRGLSDRAIEDIINRMVKYAREHGQDPEVVTDPDPCRLVEQLKRRYVKLILCSYWSPLQLYERNGLVTISARELSLFTEFGVTPVIEAGLKIAQRVRQGPAARPLMPLAEMGQELPYLCEPWSSLVTLFHLNRW